VGGLAHYFEQEGVATTQVSLIRLHTEKIRPPRALWVPFELGRPMGVPDDRPFQRRVLLAALRLLEAPAGPVLEDFPEDAPAEAAAGGDDEGWVCPIPLAGVAAAQADGPRAVLAEEIARLQPWYDLAVARRGRSTFGAAGLTIGEIAEVLLAFLAGDTPAGPRPGSAPGDLLKLASEDLKAFYAEAATAEPGRRKASGTEVQDWFWGGTAAGRLLLDLKPVCLQSADKLVRAVAMHALIPRAQLHRASDPEGRRNFTVPRGGHLADN